MNQYGFGRQMGYGGATGYGVSTGYAAMGPMTQYASNPQIVQQHIAQDLGYGGPAGIQAGHGGPAGMHAGYSGPAGMHAGYTGQTAGYQPPGYQPIQNQQYYNPAAFQQIMGSVHDDMAQIRQQIQQDIQYGSQPPTHYGHGGSTYTTANMPYGQSTLSEYGSNAQMVRSHIHQDLQYGQGMIPSGMAGGMHSGHQGYGQTASPMHAYGSNPQMVQQQIHGEHAPQHPYGYGTSMMAGMGTTIGSPMHAGATNPQSVRQQIHHDLGRQAYYS